MQTPILLKNPQAQAIEQFKKEMFAEIAKDVTCNFCQNIPKNARIFHSSEGLVACLACEDSSEMKFQQNFAVGKILQKLHIPCIYSKNGCKITQDPGNIVTHEETCGYKNIGPETVVECIFGFCTMARIQTQGVATPIMIKDLSEHCNTKHKSYVEFAKLTSNRKKTDAFAENYLLAEKNLKSLMSDLKESGLDETKSQIYVDLAGIFEIVKNNVSIQKVKCIFEKCTRTITIENLSDHCRNRHKKYVEFAMLDSNKKKSGTFVKHYLFAEKNLKKLMSDLKESGLDETKSQIYTDMAKIFEIFANNNFNLSLKEELMKKPQVSGVSGNIATHKETEKFVDCIFEFCFTSNKIKDLSEHCNTKHKTYIKFAKLDSKKKRTDGFIRNYLLAEKNLKILMSVLKDSGLDETNSQVYNDLAKIFQIFENNNFNLSQKDQLTKKFSIQHNNNVDPNQMVDCIFVFCTEAIIIENLSDHCNTEHKKYVEFAKLGLNKESESFIGNYLLAEKNLKFLMSAFKEDTKTYNDMAEIFQIFKNNDFNLSLREELIANVSIQEQLRGKEQNTKMSEVEVQEPPRKKIKPMKTEIKNETIETVDLTSKIKPMKTEIKNETIETVDLTS